MILSELLVSQFEGYCTWSLYLSLFESYENESTVLHIFLANISHVLETISVTFLLL